MVRQWSIRVDARAVRALYALPRGIAGEVTDAIDQLLKDPIPDHVEPVEEIRNVYRLTIGGHLVEYEVIEEQRAIKILNVA